MKEPACPKSAEFGGKQMFCFGAREAWISQVVAGRVRSEDLTGAVASVKKHLVGQAAVAPLDDPTGHVELGTRASLGLDSDSESGDEELVGDERDVRARLPAGGGNEEFPRRRRFEHLRSMACSS